MARKAIQHDQIVKLIVGAGQASPSPPVGPALGSKGVKSMDFCKVSRSHKSQAATHVLTALQGVQCPHRQLCHRHASSGTRDSPAGSLLHFRAAHTLYRLAPALLRGRIANEE